MLNVSFSSNSTEFYTHVYFSSIITENSNNNNRIDVQNRMYSINENVQS